MVQVYSESLYRRYYASRLSAAYLFTVGVGLTAMCLPFFLAYSTTPSFWLKTAAYREQPDVEYEYKVIVQLQGTNAEGLTEMYFSTMESVNSLHERDVRVPLLRSTNLDDNRDGLVDRVYFETLMPLKADERVYAAQVAAFYRVKLKRRARVDFEALAYYSATSSLPGDKCYIAGDYTLRQKWPFRAKGGYTTPYEAHPLLEPKTATYDQTDLAKLLAAYTMRNTTMDFAPRYTVWTPTHGPPTTTENSPVPHYAFNLTIDMRVPQGDVLYTPTATEVLKHAWVKYLAMLVVVVYLLDKLCSFIFYNQLVDTTMCVELPDDKRGKKVHTGL